MLGLLHTSPVHLEPFEALVRELAPHIPIRQHVREDLLTEARRFGHADDAVRAAVRAAVEELVNAGAHVVLCTCSTIGAAAEAAATPRCSVVRVDRPAIEHAVRSGKRIVVVAALHSALEQTLGLFAEVALLQRRSPNFVQLSCAEAWTHFEAGRPEQYLRTVAAAIDAVAFDDDLVLLAQASMADAGRYVERRGFELVSTPRSAVQAAVAACATRSDVPD